MRLSAEDPAAEALDPPARTPPAGPARPPLTVIEPRAGVSLADARELWRYRELLYYLVLREVRLRYKQTILGVGWSLFQPLSIMLMFVVFVGRMARVADATPYPYTLFVLAGALPWTFFATATLNGGNSLLMNERLVTKVYFPRLMLPLANVGAAVLDFAVAMVLAAGAMAYYAKPPGWTAVLVPAVVAVMALTATGLAVLLSALIVAQRDFRYLLMFGVQLWMLGTPCIYAPAAGPWWLALNPAYGLILNFRAALFGDPMDWPALAVSSVAGLLLLAAGLVYFRRVERTFADTI